MKYLCIDPSSEKIGVAMIDGKRIVKTCTVKIKGKTTAERLSRIWSALFPVIKSFFFLAKRTERKLIIEEPDFVAKDTRAALDVAKAYGVIVSHFDPEEVHPVRASHWIKGRARQTRKKDLEYIYGLKLRTVHEADALGVYHYYITEEAIRK